MSDRKQVFRVTATPRERFQLAHLLFNPALKQKTVRDGESMYRARRALGLLGISDMMLDRGVSDDRCKDRSTRHVFTVTHADADYIIASREKIELDTPTEHMLIPLLLQLRGVKDSGTEAEDADVALAFDEAEELPLWKRSMRPSIRRPDQFIDVFASVLADAANKQPALAPLHEAFVKATAEPQPGEQGEPAATPT